jgi:hypothetical protein
MINALLTIDNPDTSNEIIPVRDNCIEHSTNDHESVISSGRNDFPSMAYPHRRTGNIACRYSRARNWFPIIYLAQVGVTMLRVDGVFRENAACLLVAD